MRNLAGDAEHFIWRRCALRRLYAFWTDGDRRQVIRHHAPAYFFPGMFQRVRAMDEQCTDGQGGNARAEIRPDPTCNAHHQLVSRNWFRQLQRCSTLETRTGTDCCHNRRTASDRVSPSQAPDPGLAENPCGRVSGSKNRAQSSLANRSHVLHCD